MNRPLSIRVKNLFESLLAGAVSLLGFSNCDNQEVMYGTPMSFYEIKGTVTDETGRPVDGARVIMRMLDNKKALAVRSDTAFTDSKGGYQILDQTISTRYKIRMVCQPVNDSLEADSINITPSFKDNGDGWTHTARETVDFTLKFKKILQEN